MDQKKIIIAAISSVLSISTYCQELYSDTTSKFLNEVTVTAQRKSQKKLLVPYSIENVSTVQLENYQPRTVPEALMQLNGVFVQKTNHGSGSPFVRGLTGNQTLILVDGIRLNNSTFRYGPNQYLNTIDAYSIDKIEVAKGTGSVQYGTDALGGVIQVFTKEPGFSKNKNPWKGKVLLKYMSNNMEKTVRSEAIYSAEKVAAQIGATYRAFGDLLGGDTTGKQSPTGYNEFAFDAKSKFLLKENIQLTLAHQFLQQKQVAVFHKVLLENFAMNEFNPQQRMLNYARLMVDGKNNYTKRLELIASWQQTVEGRNSRKNGSNILRKERDEINTIGFTADLNSFFSDKWTANSGFEIYIDKVNSTRKDVKMDGNGITNMRGLYPDNSGYKNYSLYSLHHFDFQKWIFEAGLRVNGISISIADTSFGNTKLSPSSFVYNTSAMYNISTHQHVYLNFSTGYRAPNLDDLGSLGIVDFRYEIPANDLSAEKSRNLEIGYKFQTGRISANVAGYYMQLSDLITRIKVQDQIINGYPVYRKDNIDKAIIKGVEAEIEYEPISHLQVRAGIAYAHGESLTRNEPLRRIPPMTGRVMSTYRKNKWFGKAELLFASRQDRLAQGDKEDNRIPQGGTPGWKVINLITGFQYTRVGFNLGLQNLLNEDYRYHGSGINEVGRSAWLAVSFKI